MGKFLPDPHPAPPAFKCFTSWRELKAGMVVYFSSRLSDRLYEMYVLEVNRKERSIRYMPVHENGRKPRVKPGGTKLYGIDHSVERGELRKIP